MILPKRTLVARPSKAARSHRLQFKPKAFGDFDIDIKIDACGVCGSDVHTITGGWGKVATLPLCVGHEIIGKAVKVGPKVKTVKTGDRVGVGAQIWACLECKICKSDNENYCPHQVGMLLPVCLPPMLTCQIPTTLPTPMAPSPKEVTPATSGLMSTLPFPFRQISRPKMPRL